jgi:hypothetical protein
LSTIVKENTALNLLLVYIKFYPIHWDFWHKCKTCGNFVQCFVVLDTIALLNYDFYADNV